MFEQLCDIETGEEYWLSGPHRNRGDTAGVVSQAGNRTAGFAQAIRPGAGFAGDGAAAVAVAATRMAGPTGNMVVAIAANTTASLRSA